MFETCGPIVKKMFYDAIHPDDEILRAGVEVLAFANGVTDYNTVYDKPELTKINMLIGGNG